MKIYDKLRNVWIYTQYIWIEIMYFCGLFLLLRELLFNFWVPVVS